MARLSPDQIGKLASHVERAVNLYPKQNTEVHGDWEMKLQELVDADPGLPHYVDLADENKANVNEGLLNCLIDYYSY